LTEERLAELGLRIDRLTTSPEDIDDLLGKLVRPVLRHLGFMPATSGGRLLEWVRHDAAVTLPEVIDELEQNLASVERATIVNDRRYVHHASWLRRCWGVLSRASRDGQRGGSRLGLLPPLAVSAKDVDLVSAPDATEEAIRMVEMQLAAVDRVLETAQGENDRLHRRLRLLEAARGMLLELGAALPIDEDGVEARLDHIRRELTHLDRLEGAGIRPQVGLHHQTLSFVARGERDKLFTALQAIAHTASISGDEPAARLASAAAAALVGEAAGLSREESLARSVVEMQSEAVVDAARVGHEQARESITEEEEPVFAEALLRDHYALGQERSVLASSLAVASAFELGGRTSPAVIEETEWVSRAVRHPTQTLDLDRARRPADVVDAVIDDPRTILLSLASGRLLTRRHLTVEPQTRRRSVRRAEVRSYVLDGSSSMGPPTGHRGRMRDAILVAELSALARRLRVGDSRESVVLFYRYFTAGLGERITVDTIQAAYDAVESVMATRRLGGTDIELALRSAMEDVCEHREAEPDLERAQIVLVTDGEADVRPEVVDRWRRDLVGVDFGISVIALGEENPALRRIVAAQRAEGVRAFYHFMSDAVLRAIDSGGVGVGAVLHLPEASRGKPIEDEVAALVEELADLRRDRDEATMRQLAKAGDEPGRAVAESAFGDAHVVRRRFARWFPAIESVADAEPETVEAEDRDSMLLILGVIVEVVERIDGTELDRKADAVDLLTSLLPDAQLSPARWDLVTHNYGARLVAPMQTLHHAARHGIAHRVRMLSE